MTTHQIQILNINNYNMNFSTQTATTFTAIDFSKLINEGAWLVDVRTDAEFAEGHVAGSVNIPLHTIPDQVELFKNKGNIIVFCRSGGRSTQAKAFLDMNGIENVVNGGTWNFFNQFCS
jgi:rhodanese-related sulfurtransferase